MLAAIKKFSAKYTEVYHLPEGELSVKQQHAIAQEWYLKSKCVGFETKVFHVLHHNEVEADTGANAFLPPKKIEEICNQFELSDFDIYHHYQPSEKLASDVERIYQHLEYLPSTYHIDGGSEVHVGPSSEQSSYTMTYGHGTTEIFDAILKNIIKNKLDSIIVPTPTYGLFIPIMQEYAKIRPLPSAEEAIGSINSTFLLDLITVIEERNLNLYKENCEFKLQLLKQMDPSEIPELLDELKGMITTCSNATKAIAARQAIIDKATDTFNEKLHILRKSNKINKALYQHLNLEVLPRVRVLYVINPAMPSGKILIQPEVNEMVDILENFPSIHIIEDETHRGIKLDDSKSFGTFAKTSIADRVLILDGISKTFGLATARAAFAIGHRTWINPISDSLKLINCTLNGASNAFLEGVYNLKSSEFDAHLKDISKGYRSRLQVVKAIIYGLNETIEAKQQAVFLKAFYKRMETESQIIIPEKYRSSIFSGIPGLKLYNEPEGGYFVLLDLSEFSGQYIGEQPLLSGMDFRNAFYNLADVNSIADIMCYDVPGKGKAYIRYSLSMDKEIDIVEGLLRIKRVLSCLKPAPEVTQKTLPSTPSSANELPAVNVPVLTPLKRARELSRKEDSIEERSDRKRIQRENDTTQQAHIQKDEKRQCVPTRKSARIAKNPKIKFSRAGIEK